LGLAEIDADTPEPDPAVTPLDVVEITRASQQRHGEGA